MKKVRETFGVSRTFDYLCTCFKQNKILHIMTPIISHRGAIVTDRKGVSFSYRSPIGERTVKLSHAFIAKSASEAYARVVNRKK